MLIFAFVNKVAHVGFTGLHNKTQSSANFSLHLTHRRSTKWWALWSWWRWTRMVWHQSSGWTRSSAKWIRTTTIRSHWRSSKRRQRATRPSCFSCSVTCRSEPSPLARLPVCDPHTLDSSTCFNVSLSSLPFPQEKNNAWTIFQWTRFLWLYAWECQMLNNFEYSYIIHFYLKTCQCELCTVTLNILCQP